MSRFPVLNKLGIDGHYKENAKTTYIKRMLNLDKNYKVKK